MCIRILQKNIDGKRSVFVVNQCSYDSISKFLFFIFRVALEQIGSIPFDILKPVLQLASPEQLFTIESYNPYLMEDTDVLWEFHGKRKFRNNKRLELETWREMFLVSTQQST